DYNKAYDYLSDSMARKPTRDQFVSYNLQSSNYEYNQQARILIDSEQTYGDNATVKVNVTHYYYSSGPFAGSSDYTSSEAFTLKREQGAWRITELPYEYMPIQ